ncbi:DUF6461 domain-containing protein [Nocardia transvalensis]|uniref:DUF6461 domain-containing protein n=1 Tax=Nocardia transvalensis TaxID=37333 RepID=UPI003A5CCC9B
MKGDPVAVDDLAWADGGGRDSLGETYCLTFIRDVDAAEALRRMGGLPGTFATRTWSDVGDLDNFDDDIPRWRWRYRWVGGPSYSSRTGSTASA